MLEKDKLSACEKLKANHLKTPESRPRDWGISTKNRKRI